MWFRRNGAKPGSNSVNRKFIVLYLLGFRKQAVSIIGREVMAPKGLLGLGVDTLDYSGAEIRKILLLYADPHSLPNLVHCTQGKDRTGTCHG